MTDNLENLKQAYREIKAPPYLATRIRAEVAGRATEQFSWKPISAAGIMAIVAVSLLSVMWQQQTRVVAPEMQPSLAALAALAPKKPAVSTPGLSQLRSVKAPSMPVKPRPKNSKPQSNLDNEIEKLEDRDNAYI